MSTPERPILPATKKLTEELRAKARELLELADDIDALGEFETLWHAAPKSVRKKMLAAMAAGEFTFPEAK